MKTRFQHLVVCLLCAILLPACTIISVGGGPYEYKFVTVTEVATPRVDEDGQATEVVDVLPLEGVAAEQAEALGAEGWHLIEVEVLELEGDSAEENALMLVFRRTQS